MPNSNLQNGYSLRASSYGRETDLLVCIVRPPLALWVYVVCRALY